MSETMSRRFQVTLPDAVYADLEERAKREGRPLANLAAFLIEASIKNLEPQKEKK